MPTFAPKSFRELPNMMLGGMSPGQMLEFMYQGSIRQPSASLPPMPTTNTFTATFDSTGDPNAASNAAAIQSSQELENRLIRLISEQNRTSDAVKQAKLLQGVAGTENYADVFDVVSNNYGEPVS